MQLPSIYPQRIRLPAARTAALRSVVVPLCIIGVVGAIYLALLTFYLGPLNGFWSSDQGTKLIQMQSLLLTKYRTNALIYPGEAYDPEHTTSPLRGTYTERAGAIYSVWSPSFPFVSSIPFFLLGYAGLYVVPITSTLLTLWFCVLLGRRIFDRVWIVIALLVCGLASPLFFYSLVFWEHTLATCLVTAAVWWTVRCVEQGQAARMLLTGLLIGVSVWFREETILCAVALIFAVYIAKKAIVLRYGWYLSLSLAPLVVLLLLFNRWVYGSFVGPHIAVTSTITYGEPLTLRSFIATRLQWADMLLVPFVSRLLLVSVLALCLVRLVTLLTNSAWTGRLGYILSLVLMIVAAVTTAVLLSNGVLTNPILNGGEQSALIVAFPFALLCLVPLNRSACAAEVPLTVADAGRILFWFAVSYISIAWVLQMPWGGAQWGPRTLLPALPALILASLYRASTWFGRSRSQPLGIALLVAPIAGSRRTGSRWLIEPGLAITLVVLIAASLLAEGYGMQKIGTTNRRNHFIMTSVAQSGQQVVITDTWYAPTLLAPLFYDGHLIFLVDQGSDLDQLVARLRAQGITSFYYLGARARDVSANSTVWPHLTALEAAKPFAYHLAGTPYRLAP